MSVCEAKENALNEKDKCNKALDQAISDYMNFVKLQECVSVLAKEHGNSLIARGCFATALWGGECVPKDQAAAKAMFEDGSLLLKLRGLAEGSGPLKSQSAMVLGWAYGDGFVGKKDLDVAFRWFKLAADLGLPRGFVEVSRCYQTGSSVAADPGRAFHYATLAADAGCAAGLFQLGHYYLTGTGVDKDPAKAVSFSRRSADMGCPAGQFGLAMCYEQGVGVPKDPVQAVHFYRLAAQQDFSPAVDALKRLGK